jgi:MFS family permease
MAKLVRCKVCGYIMPEGKLGGKCPACGAPDRAFEPYEDPMSEARRRLLSKHLHPIAVHFPTAFAATLVVLAIAAPLFADRIQQLLLSTARILAIFTPLLVIVGLLTGVLDGRIRFRSLRRSAILKRKLALALLFFLFSAGFTLLIWLSPLFAPGFTLLAIAAAIAAFICSFLLGLLGASVLNSAFPGK